MVSTRLGGETVLKITKIEPTQCFTAYRKTRVAAYARVSTDSDDQLQSLDAQKEYYESFIKGRSDWNYAGLYYDEGITGTKVEKREGLLNLLKDCKAGKIDRVITKSISRFSRNTENTLEMVRSLNQIGVYIYFEKENIDTEHMNSELMLSILGSIAESESKSISENSKWGVRHRYLEGTYKISYPPYGYRNDDGKMVVVPSEAEVVKKIFDMALAGHGSLAIAKELNSKNIPSKRGGSWHPSSVQDILRNEKYTGDAIFQKTYTDGNFRRHHNYGDVDRYLCQNHHEAIIDHETFDKVADAVQRRGAEKGIIDGEKYQNRYAFTGKIICGDCGATFKRRSHYKKSGDFIAWTCKTHLSDQLSCGMLYVKEEHIKAAFIKMMNKLRIAHPRMLRPFVDNLRGINSTDRLRQIKALEEKIRDNNVQQQVLAELMASGYTDPGTYQEEKNMLLIEADRLAKEKESLSSYINGNLTHLTEAEKLLKYISRVKNPVAYDDELFLAFVESVTVKDRETYTFNLKCGLKLTERVEVE